MRSERGQGTVEYVGLVLVVAVLVGAIAGGFGLPQLTAGIVSSITRALLGATGIATRPQGAAFARPSAADRAAFARASDVRRSGRSPLAQGVRLALMQQHGDEQGRAIYRQLIIDDLEAAIPALAEPTLFATATPELQPPRRARGLPPDRCRGLALRAPTGRDAGEWELPASTPNAHVVTVAEADAALDRALHPGHLGHGHGALDIASVVPLGRLAGGVVVRKTERARGSRKGHV